MQFPKDDAEAFNQAMRARYQEFDTVQNAQLESDAAAVLADKIGPTVALTNSAGGLRALLTALKSDNIKGIVMYENVGYVFPEGEGPDLEPGPFGPVEVPLEDFRKLTRIPLQAVFGDNVEKSANYRASARAGQALRRGRQQIRRQGRDSHASRRGAHGQHAHSVRGHEQRCGGRFAFEVSRYRRSLGSQELNAKGTGRDTSGPGAIASMD